MKMNYWTQEEINLLLNGKDVPGRSINAIRNKRYKLGIYSEKRLSKEEIQNIIENKPLKKKRHQNTIRRTLIKLGLKEKRKTRERWSQFQITQLIDLHEKGNSAKIISEMGIFTQSENAIQKKLCRLGLTNKVSIFKFDQTTKNRFKNFLLENWKGKTPKELLEIWNIENAQKPANLRKVIIYLRNLNIKISCYEVQKINNLRKKEKQINLENKGSVNIMLEKIRKERVKLMRARFSEKKDIWTGLEISESEVFSI